jgi:alkanesulfonate monooxygenase SsuD/methylene tetrahydromethanopterin reductase-like flavin-dependent oxidoreductase (luciferase family)
MEFAVQTRGGYDLILATARWAEKEGLAALALPDHYLDVYGNPSEAPAFDHFIHFAALARDTESLELVSLLAPVTFRHPAVLYKMGVTLDEISGGRFTLGVGAGWFDEEFELFGLDYPSQRELLDRRLDAMRYLAAAIRPGAVGHDGEFYQLAEFDPQPHPKRLRLLIGGGGMVETPTVAGEYADEFNIYACPVDDFRVKVKRAREAAEAAGRDPDNLLISSAGPAVAAQSESAYERLKNTMADLLDIEPGRLAGGYRKRGYPHGFGDQPAEMIATLEEAGCQRFYLRV